MQQLDDHLGVILNDPYCNAVDYLKLLKMREMNDQALAIAKSTLTLGTNKKKKKKSKRTFRDL